MSQVVSANIKTFFMNNDKFSSKFVKILHFRSFLRARSVVGPHPARTGCIVIRKLSRERADIVREYGFAVIGADGGEGDIVQDDLGDIAEIRSVGREIRPLVERH